MTLAIREHITVEQEGIIEIRNPALSVGIRAEVIVLIEQPATEDQPLVNFIGKGKGCFANAAEVDSFLRAGRDDLKP
jgi:hypothetical protein